MFGWTSIRKLLSRIKFASRQTIRTGNIILAFPISLAQLIAHYRDLHRAQVIVTMGHPSGFGNTILGPDVARRLFPNQRTIFAVFCSNSSHNWKAGLIWPDIQVVYFRLKLRRSLSGAPVTEPLTRLLHGLIKRVAKGGTTVIGPSLWDLFGRVPLPDDFNDNPNPGPPLLRWKNAYFKLQREVPGQPVLLPSKSRARVHRSLNHALGPNTRTSPDTKLCNI